MCPSQSLKYSTFLPNLSYFQVVLEISVPFFYLSISWKSKWKKLIFLKKTCNPFGRNRTFQICQLSSTVIIKATYLSFISIPGESNCGYFLLASAFNCFIRKNSEVMLSTYGIFLLAHMYPGVGWLTK